MTVLPTQVAPCFSRFVTTSAVRLAAVWVLFQSGFPNPATQPSISKLKTQ
jgi:hypothetical protein